MRAAVHLRPPAALSGRARRTPVSYSCSAARHDASSACPVHMRRSSSWTRGLTALLQRTVAGIAREAAVLFVVVGASMVFLFAGERITAWVRKARFEGNRAKAQYPMTGNDSEGRTVVF